jgi:magnesium chelatase family protein
MRGFARITSAQPAVTTATLVTVEADLSRGMYAFSIVGLPDKAVEEARDRMASAIRHSGFESPKAHNRKVVVSLAPAEVRKEGAYFDLPIALCYLLAAEEIRFDPAHRLFVGELSLNGSVRPVRGILAIAKAAQEIGFREIYVPAENAAEAALIDGIAVFGVRDLRSIVQHLDQTTPPTIEPQPLTVFVPGDPSEEVDFSDVRGQEAAKRALEIAAAGRHNIALWGPPGTGKTLLARALRSILPPLSVTEALEATMIHSLTGTLGAESMIRTPPFRSPHHSASYVALVGGGASIRPGEVTLAHRGVLFLDEFPEFDKRSIEALREPLENRVVTISRAKGSQTFPADFILIAALNPSTSHQQQDTLGTERDRVNLARKISGPIADRFDLWVSVGPIDHEKLTASSRTLETSHAVRDRVIGARLHQYARFGNLEMTNAAMGVRELERLVPISSEVAHTARDAAVKLSLSPRAFHRTLKIARTIADLAHERYVTVPHVLEALQYRPKELFAK